MSDQQYLHEVFTEHASTARAMVSQLKNTASTSYNIAPDTEMHVVRWLSTVPHTTAKVMIYDHFGDFEEIITTIL